MTKAATLTQYKLSPVVSPQLKIKPSTQVETLPCAGVQSLIALGSLPLSRCFTLPPPLPASSSLWSSPPIRPCPLWLSAAPLTEGLCPPLLLNPRVACRVNPRPVVCPGLPRDLDRGAAGISSLCLQTEAREGWGLPGRRGSCPEHGIEFHVTGVRNRPPRAVPAQRDTPVPTDGGGSAGFRTWP